MNTEYVIESIKLFTRAFISSAGSAFSMALENTTLKAFNEN